MESLFFEIEIYFLLLDLNSVCEIYKILNWWTEADAFWKAPILVTVNTVCKRRLAKGDVCTIGRQLR